MPYGLPPAFFLTDPVRTPDPAAIVKALPRGTGVIYRHFGADDRFETGLILRKACYHKGLPLLIANDPKLAIAVRADGVHWPEAQAHQARKWQGRFFFQTQSVHSAAGMRRALCDGVLFSTVFPSNSPSAGMATGPIRFRLLARKSGRAIYALGGVNGATAGRVAGFSGLAAIEGFLTQ